ncbi:MULTISPECIES: beta-ketoacyl synthase N-terminal-like domain-containing protein [Prauserella salsuginis group]|uniref:Beta-ketoacyl synthase N-terminal-like domain-containing protein n=1 Tax=Prauserella salsuginis TaxID=387889 RepID=A0ABW6G2K3_9PSEU|nr:MULTISPECIES: beta-ketoacyl synthase N-terminal-like domain-containing protein [Prauserella salsuginis group]MCR3719791.1 3-oxoacyl-[acyl-carrier-protein] synthase II [Prauserella flava]MCR3736666.1 3-oxoacyl-[acyl-carrier-protein] synthase II [Prauserella salsuginis]
MTGAVITAWSAISACGIGAAAHRAAYGDPARRPPPTPVGDPVPGEAHVAADFDVTEALGPKGTSSMDRCSGIAVAVAAEPLTAGQRAHAVPEGSVTGVVLGTTSGSAQTQLDFTRESLTRSKPYRVNPALMPFALMNSAAGQTAIWHGLTGPNTTIAGGRMSGLSTLRYGARLLATGRADAVLCGAVEEYGPARQWLADQRTPAAAGRRPLGEGGAVLLLEPAADDPLAASGDGAHHQDAHHRDAHHQDANHHDANGAGGRTPLAELLGVDTRVDVDDDPAAALDACIRRTLDRAGLTGGDVGAVAVSGPPGPLAGAERDAVARTAARADVRDPGEILGDTGAAAGPFQVTLLLDRPGVALVTAVDEDGTVGCGLLRVY